MRYTLVLDDEAVRCVEELRTAFKLKTKADVYDLATSVLMWCLQQQWVGYEIGRSRDDAFQPLLIPGAPQSSATPVASDRDSLVPSPSAQPAEPKERTTYEQWFLGEQGKPYGGMWEFARSAWNAALANPKEPLTEAQQTALWKEADKDWATDEADFKAGIRAAERAHGIQEQPKESKDATCPHGIHYDNACGACIPPRGTR